MLKDANFKARRDAAIALYFYGKSAASAVSQLVESLDDSNTDQ
jgi:hypothetical protein